MNNGGGRAVVVVSVWRESVLGLLGARLVGGLGVLCHACAVGNRVEGGGDGGSDQLVLLCLEQLPGS